MKAHAVVFVDRMQVEYQRVEVPDPTPDDVVIEVAYSWISPGTESSFLRGERISGEVPYREGDPWPFPHVAGYQKVGRVCSIGANVTDIQVGDRVFATVSKVSHMFYDSGGHVSPAVTHHSQVWKIPEERDFLHYSGMVLAQVGLNCGSRPPVQQGDVAVVIGDGLVGHWAAQTLLHRGAHVVVLGHRQERLRHVPTGISGKNLREQSLPEALSRLEGVHIVVDSVGSMETVYALLPYMKHDSHLVSAGFLGETGSIDIQKLRGQEITLHCPSGWSSERLEQTLRGITEGWLQTARLITHLVPVAQAHFAWQMLLDPASPCLGVVLAWQ